MENAVASKRPGSAWWHCTPREAVALQRTLANAVVLQPAAVPARVVGLDCAIQDDHILAVAVVWDIRASAIVEIRGARMPVPFPYVPGLLSFREVPVLEQVLTRVQSDYGGVICDGQGIAHPRRLGLASHLGLRLGLPAVGCAKSRLCGVYAEPGPRRGDWAALYAEAPAGQGRAERIGAVLRTREKVRPVFVSPGHLIDHDGSIAWVLACGAGFRLPEPTRQADRWVGEFKRAGRLPRLAEVADGAGRAVRR